MHENEITYLIRQSAYNVHVALGPGLLESAYEAALMHELRSVGLRVQNQVGLPMNYGGIKLDVGYRIDLLVEDKVIVELKALETLLDVHHMQLVTYLKLSGCKAGLLINFNVARIKDGMFRKVNGLAE
ncbi:GxxExxY protein [Hymenobacter sp. IS2118]|uniref:GxxExxY protein n=1 Tax=Hymenobacter sp. IS2118 TaxID=1505605 RepID=UPI0005582F7C|nr:GxxExxY protein [Hymenobacter sp. IS2118]